MSLVNAEATRSTKNAVEVNLQGIFNLKTK